MTGAYPVLRAGSFESADPLRPARPWARTFPGVAASVPEARRFVTGLLDGCPAREVLVACVSELSTNAIVHTDSGNGGVFTVEVELPRDGTARVSVTDAGGPSRPTAGSLRRPAPLDATSALGASALGASALGASALGASALGASALGASGLGASALLNPAGPLELMAEGGRGLALVAACTSRWGYGDAHPGRTVWAEACWPVPIPRPGPEVPGQAVPGQAVPGQAVPGQAVPGQATRQPRPRFPRLTRSPRRRSRFSAGPRGDYPSGPAA
jgi:Histidine kinase-like ATPase domain